MAHTRALIRGVGMLALAAFLQGSGCQTRNDNNPELLRHQVACVQYLEKQDLDSAETRCKLCLEYEKANPECNNALGMMWYLRGNWEEAKKYYKRAMRARPDFPEARNNMGVIEMEENDYSDAEELFSSAIKINPGYEDGRANLAWCYRVRGDIEYAGADKRVVKGNMNRKDPNLMKGTFSGAESYYAQADDQLRRVFEINPKRFGAYALMGFIELQRASYFVVDTEQKKHLLRSQEMSSRCVELAPTDNADAKFCRGNLAYAYELTGNFELAMTNWQGCLALDPKEPQCIEGFNRAYAGFAARAGGLKKYIEQISANPGYAQGHFNLCVAAFELNLTDIGAASCENAIQLDKNLCLPHYHLGKHYRTVLNQQKAIGYCKSFISCSGTVNPVEVQECKDLISALEVQ